MRILLAFTRFRDTREGDVKPLTDRAGLLRTALIWQTLGSSFDATPITQSQFLNTRDRFSEGAKITCRLTFKGLLGTFG